MTDNKMQIPVTTQRGNISVLERLKVFDNEECFAVLATNDNGQPYTSLIAYALTADLKKVIFTTPKKTRKYRNILNTGNVSILIDNRTRSRKDLLEAEAITVMGTARTVRRGRTWDETASVFLAKHPEFESFLYSPATALIEVTITSCVHVSRFQTISTWDCR